MKKKAFITICLTAVLIMALVTPALASGADNVRDEMDELLAAYPGNANLIKLVDDAKRWLAKEENASTITEHTASVISIHINDAMRIAGSAVRMSQLDDSQRNAIVEHISAAATAAGLKFEAGANFSSFTLKDASGNVISSITLRNPIKQTGIDRPVTGIIIISIIMLLTTGFAAGMYLSAVKTAIKPDAKRAA